MYRGAGRYEGYERSWMLITGPQPIKELPLNSSKTKTILIGYGILLPKKISDLPTLSVFKQHILQLDLNSLRADPQC